ncbi:hypothetical protein ANTHELSMS3_04878 (plasmid) [Antarctobacter heliothermus]|uniref:Uncharacterized protein n=1 Tax=Antarctobacter heliothermus TaxID=74033 RepID=A0A222EB21_9RHOB|nr:hypothetical protein ANTHELSMS3_04878 [Antarctobacter heliothermus]
MACVVDWVDMVTADRLVQAESAVIASPASTVLRVGILGILVVWATRYPVLASRGFRPQP